MEYMKLACRAPMIHDDLVPAYMLPVPDKETVSGRRQITLQCQHYFFMQPDKFVTFGQPFEVSQI